MLVKVELMIEVPEPEKRVDFDNIRRWIEFELGYSSEIGTDNPLVFDFLKVTDCDIIF